MCVVLRLPYNLKYSFRVIISKENSLKLSGSLNFCWPAGRMVVDTSYPSRDVVLVQRWVKSASEQLMVSQEWDRLSKCFIPRGKGREGHKSFSISVDGRGSMQNLALDTDSTEAKNKTSLNITVLPELSGLHNDSAITTAVCNYLPLSGSVPC